MLAAAAGDVAGALNPVSGERARAGRLARRLGSRVHPHDAADAAPVLGRLLPRRGARAAQHPGRGPRPARGQPLRRHADRGHVRVRAGLLRPLRAAAALPPARPRPRVPAAGRRGDAVALRDRAGVAGEHGERARARRRAARLSRRRPRDLPPELGVRGDRLRRPHGLREARDRARRADRAGGGHRRPGDRALPRAGPPPRAAAAARQPAAAEGASPPRSARRSA